MANFFSVIFKDSFTQALKNREDKKVIPLKGKNDLGWGFVGYANPFQYKEILDFKSYRTYKSFNDAIDDECAVYFTPNTFSSRKTRDSKRLRWLNAFFIDIDEKGLVIDDIFNRLNSSGLPVPTLINKTPRGGYHLFWSLEERIAATPKAKYLYDLIQSKMVFDMGADINAIGAERLIRVPDNVVFENLENQYDLGFFKDWFNINKVNKAVQAKTNNVVFLNGYNIMQDRAVQKILSEGAQKGERNEALFNLALVFKECGYGLEDSCEKLLEWNSANGVNLSTSEVCKTVLSAYKKDYRFSTIRLSAIAGIKCNAYRVFKKHKKARSERKRTHYKEWATDIFLFLKKNGNKFKGSQKELAKKLNAPERSVKKALKMIKNKDIRSNILVTVKGRGRASKTVLELIAAKPIHIDRKKSKIHTISNNEKNVNETGLKICAGEYVIHGQRGSP